MAVIPYWVRLTLRFIVYNQVTYRMKIQEHLFNHFHEEIKW